MSVYKWAMRHASMILFVISAAIFLIGFGQAMVALTNSSGSAVYDGHRISPGLMSFLMLLAATFSALSSAALPFIGAVAIDRWDRRKA